MSKTIIVPGGWAACVAREREENAAEEAEIKLYWANQKAEYELEKATIALEKAALRAARLALKAAAEAKAT